MKTSIGTEPFTFPRTDNLVTFKEFCLAILEHCPSYLHIFQGNKLKLLMAWIYWLSIAMKSTDIVTEGFLKETLMVYTVTAVNTAPAACLYKVA